MEEYNGGFHSSTSHPSSIEETLTFNDLSPDTEYEVKIQARNSYGWSDNEPVFVFKTSHRGKLSKLFFETQCENSSIFETFCIRTFTHFCNFIM